MDYQWSEGICSYKEIEERGEKNIMRPGRGLNR